MELVSLYESTNMIFTIFNWLNYISNSKFIGNEYSYVFIHYINTAWYLNILEHFCFHQIFTEVSFMSAKCEKYYTIWNKHITSHKIAFIVLNTFSSKLLSFIVNKIFITCATVSLSMPISIL